MKKIYYLSYYDIPNGNRLHTLSCTNKMDYIISVLNKMGYEVEIISASPTMENKYSFEEYKEIKPNVYLKTFKCLGNGNGIKRVLQRTFTKVQLKKYIACLNPAIPIIVYHSLGYIDLYKYIANKMTKFVLEVEEIYSDVTGNTQLRRKEIKAMKVADYYIFPTKLLSEAINEVHKPEIIIHGTYRVEKDRDVDVFAEMKYKDKIHCVYAGTLDPRKGGAFAAIEATRYIPSNYHMHILGFGTEEEVEKTKDRIRSISHETEASITYDGVLSGEDYINFLQSCTVGLSTQNPDGAYNASSFPSKILSYMSNGLKVVSIRIPAVETSAISDCLFYYVHQDPKEIAEAIVKAGNSNCVNPRIVINELDKTFTKEIEQLLV